MNLPPRILMSALVAATIAMTWAGIGDWTSAVQGAGDPPTSTPHLGVQVTAGSFEQPEVTDHAFGIKGWRLEVAGGRNGSAGVFGPSRPVLPKMPEGRHCAFLFGDPSVAWVKIWQDAGTVEAGRTYRLAVQVGRQAAGGDGRSDLPPYRIILRDSSDDSVKASVSSPVTPEPGQFKLATLDYTPTTSHKLRICFEADSTPASTAVLLDDVAISLRTPDQVKADRDRPAEPVDYLLGAAGGNSMDRMVNRRAARLALVEKPAKPPTVDGPLFNDVDRFIAARWRDAKPVPGRKDPTICDDSAFLRRVYLDVIGVSPTLAETRRFLDDAKPDKRARLIDELLARNVDYAAHWTVFWLDALASNVAPTFGGVISRGDHLPWVHSSFAANKAYDIFAAELIDPTMPGFKRPGHIDILGVRYKVSFLRDADHNEVLQTAADVGQVFLGTGMKCASCHNHFENDEWPQKRFLAFAGLFSGKDLEQIRCEKRSGKFVAAASPFDQPGMPAVAPADATTRLHLAALLLTDPANPRFARTIVNRLWKRYLGLGLFEPADDFRTDTPASHPQLLDWLAYDFMQHGYDLKHTIRLILNSRTYQLQYDPRFDDRFDVLQPRASTRLFRTPSLRRLTAEQLIDSLAVITKQKLDDRQRVYRVYEGVPDALNNALGRPDIRSEVSTARSGEATIVQTLELLNGARYNALINPDALLASLGPAPKAQAIVELLYLATLQRGPTAEEIALGVAFLRESNDDKIPLRDAVKDMLWAIVTSPAFQYVH